MSKHVALDPNRTAIDYSFWQLIKDTLDLVKPYKGRFVIASILRLIGDLVWLYPAFALATIVTFLTHYKPGDSLRTVWVILALWFLAIVIRNLSQFFSKYLGYFVSQNVAIDSNLKAIKHMFLLDMSWHERENSGNKIKRVENAGDGFTRIIGVWFDSVIEIAVNLFAITFIIARIDHVVVYFLIAFLITYFFISRVMTLKASEAGYIVNKQEEEVNGFMFEAISNIRTIKMMSMAEALYDFIAKSTNNLLGKIRIRIFWYQSRNAFLSFWALAFKVGIIAIIIVGITEGHYEIGFLILFNSYFSDIHESIDELSTAGVYFATSRYSISRMKEILDEPINIDSETGKIPLPSDWKKIKFENVSFSYGENKVLDNVSFEINRGEKIGIIGLSGAGKSTLFKLLLKEREGSDGSIMFDDVPLKQISKSDYFKHASVVLQDTEVFNFSLKNNITITNIKEENNKDLLEQALKTSHISDFVGKLPKGVDTIIGEKGIKLSGGERQRLGIARAIFKNPQILLLDEATSHLDLESEEKIKDSLHQFFESVTAVVIAHRLTTIKEMDKIIVIEDGKIIESGNFEHLYTSKGRFYELWEKQKI